MSVSMFPNDADRLAALSDTVKVRRAETQTSSRQAAGRGSTSAKDRGSL